MTTDLIKYRLQENFPQINPVCQTLLAGSITGFSSLFVQVPVDLLKQRAQMKKEGNLNYRLEVETIIKTHGLQGLYRGFIMSAARHVPGWGIYFAAYHQCKIFSVQLNEKLGGSKETKEKRLTLMNINAGGMAGVLTWPFIFVQDIIKTRQQMHTGLTPLKAKDILA